MDFKTNVTKDVIGELLFADQSTVSRVTGELEGLIAEVLGEFDSDLAEEVDRGRRIADFVIWHDEPFARTRRAPDQKPKTAPDLARSDVERATGIEPA